MSFSLSLSCLFCKCANFGADLDQATSCVKIVLANYMLRSPAHGDRLNLTGLAQMAQLTRLVANDLDFLNESRVNLKFVQTFV